MLRVLRLVLAALVTVCALGGLTRLYSPVCRVMTVMISQKPARVSAALRSST